MATPKGAGNPFYNPRPDLQTAFNQGTMTDTGSASYQTWDDVVKNDRNVRDALAVSPENATNYLRAAYGLPNTYKVDEQGNIKDTHGFLVRNLWWIAPAALVGGSVLDAVAGGGGSSAGSATPKAGAISGTGAKIGTEIAKNAPKTATNGKSVLDALKSAVSTPKGLAGVAGAGMELARLFRGPGDGAGNPFGASSLEDQAAEALKLQTDRLRATQPVFDSVINQAYGMTPMSYRSQTPPAAFTPNRAREGAYVYESPRFGR